MSRKTCRWCHGNLQDIILEVIYQTNKTVYIYSNRIQYIHSTEWYFCVNIFLRCKSSHWNYLFYECWHVDKRVFAKTLQSHFLGWGSIWRRQSDSILQHRCWYPFEKYWDFKYGVGSNIENPWKMFTMGWQSTIQFSCHSWIYFGTSHHIKSIWFKFIHSICKSFHISC